jgi:hypothetical protein
MGHLVNWAPPRCCIARVFKVPMGFPREERLNQSFVESALFSSLGYTRGEGDGNTMSLREHAP